MLVVISFLSVTVAANQPPETPDMPEGPTEIIVGEENNVTAFTTDPDNDQIKYGWDWDGDYIVDGWTEFVPSGTEVNTVHIYTARGSYDIQVKAKDIHGYESGWSESLNVRIAILGDMNDDGTVDDRDVPAFVAAQAGGESYFYTVYPDGAFFAADINRDGYVNFGDINPFNQLLAEATNQQPEQPSTPDGLTEGVIGEELTFSTNTSDPDENQVYYKWDWGDEIGDWMGPYNSSDTIEASHIWTESGIYDIQVKAKDIYDNESEWSPKLAVTIINQTSELLHLVITAPSTVYEGNPFDVIVKEETTGDVVADVDVTFNEETNQTDDDGQITFTAPPVEDDADYTIIANKEGYQSDTTSITVKNEYDIIPKGWIYGTVSDSSGNPIKDASVCVNISGYESKCVLTDDQGRYNFLVPTGTYMIEASKPGYETSTKTVTITENGAIEVNFILKKQISPAIGNQRIVDYTFSQEADKIGARIDFDSSGEKSISYYSEKLTIELNATEEVVSFTVVADDGTSGTILVIRIGEGVLSDLDNITVTFDGESINESTVIEKFFDIQNNSTPSWLGFLTKTGLYIFVRIPHFSEHTITISSIIGEVVEVLGGPVAVMLYIVICVAGASAFLYPYFAWPARVRKGKKL